MGRDSLRNDGNKIGLENLRKAPCVERSLLRITVPPVLTEISPIKRSPFGKSGPSANSLARTGAKSSKHIPLLFYPSGVGAKGKGHRPCSNGTFTGLERQAARTTKQMLTLKIGLCSDPVGAENQA